MPIYDESELTDIFMPEGMEPTDEAKKKKKKGSGGKGNMPMDPKSMPKGMPMSPSAMKKMMGGGGGKKK